MANMYRNFRQKQIPILYLLSLLIFTACQPALTPVARPTASVLTVQSTPALQSLGDAYRTCVEALETTGLVLLETHASALDPRQADLVLRWGAGSALQDYAAVIGQEELVVIANPRNPLNSIALADLQAIYSGARREWTAGAEIQPWVYLNDDDAQSVFEAALLGGQPPSRRVVSLAPDPAAMREAVAESKDALGFLPRRWLDQTVKEITVTGLDPAQMVQPILAVSRAEPQGMQKQWLLCLQDQLSK